MNPVELYHKKLSLITLSYVILLDLLRFQNGLMSNRKLYRYSIRLRTKSHNINQINYYSHVSYHTDSCKTHFLKNNIRPPSEAYYTSSHSPIAWQSAFWRTYNLSISYLFYTLKRTRSHYSNRHPHQCYTSMQLHRVFSLPTTLSFTWHNAERFDPDTQSSIIIIPTDTQTRKTRSHVQT